MLVLKAWAVSLAADVPGDSESQLISTSEQPSIFSSYTYTTNSRSAAKNTLAKVITFVNIFERVITFANIFTKVIILANQFCTSYIRGYVFLHTLSLFIIYYLSRLIYVGYRYLVLIRNLGFEPRYRMRLRNNALCGKINIGIVGPIE